MAEYQRRPLLVEAFRLGERGKPTPAPHWFHPFPGDVTDDGIVVDIRGGGTDIALWGWWVVRNEDGTTEIFDDEQFSLFFEPV